MKSLILIIVLILSSNCYAFDGEVWIGQYNNQNYPANPSFTSKASYTAGIEIGHIIKWKDFSFRPYTKINTFIDNREGLKFHPAGVQYFLGGRLSYDNLFVEYEHLCWHPVDTGGEVYKYNMLKIGTTFGRD